MDTASITKDVAAYLVGRDDIAEATVTVDLGVILVRTQGGKGYTVTIENGSDRAPLEETATD